MIIFFCIFSWVVLVEYLFIAALKSTKQQKKTSNIIENIIIYAKCFNYGEIKGDTSERGFNIFLVVNREKNKSNDFNAAHES